MLNSFLMDLLQHSFLSTVAELTQHAAVDCSVGGSVCQDLIHFIVKCWNRSTTRACYATVDSASNHSEQKTCLIVCIYRVLESAAVSVSYQYRVCLDC